LNGRIFVTGAEGEDAPELGFAALRSEALAGERSEGQD